MVAAGSPRPAAGSSCLHCGLPVGAGTAATSAAPAARPSTTCCASEGLDRYYALRGARGVPVAERHAGARRDAKWLEAVEEPRARERQGHARV